MLCLYSLYDNVPEVTFFFEKLPIQQMLLF